MEGQNRKVSEWLEDARRGVLRLPRFQRKEVWNRNRVVNFLTALLKKHPIGYFLELLINPEREPFKTRLLSGVTEDTAGERCTRNLLDGQQRLTALWKSFTGRYAQEEAAWSPYLQIKKKDDGTYEIGERGVYPVTHTRHNQAVIGNPAEEFRRHMLPITVLNPVSEDRGSLSVVDWRRQADPDDQALETFLGELRDIVTSAFIPTLALPPTTDREVAVDVFIESNQSSLQLSPYDLAVAQMERKTRKSLQELVDHIQKKVDNLTDIEPREIGDLVLKVACLWQNKKPTLGAYQNLNFGTLQSDRDALVAGFQWAVTKHQAIGITDDARLPTSVPLRVLPVLHRSFAKIRGTANKHNASTIVDRYLWRAFLTDRYERDANTRLKEDHDTLVLALQGRTKPEDVPAISLPLPSEEDFTTHLVSWPKGGSRLARAALLVLSQDGAKDLSSSSTSLLSKPSKDSEYHHIFPRNALKKHAPNAVADTALNCMLLEPGVNREWTEKLPGDYLSKLIDEMDPKTVRETFKTHMLDLDELLACREDRFNQIPDLYSKFLNSRAEQLVAKFKSSVPGGL